MTQDEIIEMARQTHLPYFWETGVPCNLSGLEAFAKLVAAKEREACAKVADEMTMPDWVNEQIATAIRARAQADRGEA
jgi:hypothetical protein